VTSSARSVLTAALLASIAMHALLVAALESQLGTRLGAISLDFFGAPLRAVLRSPPAPGVQPAVADQPQRITAGESSLPPQQRYYRTRELDVRPGIMTRVDPVYPDAAARRFLTGKVVIRLFIDEAGAVERVVTVKAEPSGYFEQSAERAFRAASFTPGMKNGRPVKVQMLLEVSFDGPPAPAAPGGPLTR
jgi:TonB family protein